MKILLSFICLSESRQERSEKLIEYLKEVNSKVAIKDYPISNSSTDFLEPEDSNKADLNKNPYNQIKSEINSKF